MVKLRKIDVFFLIDISGSMTGEPIDSMNIAIKNTINTLCEDQRTTGNIRLCIQTYNSKIYETHQLTPIEDLKCDFNSLGFAEGSTHSGAAIEYSLAKIQKTIQEYDNNSPNFKKPLLFHITDGCPTDIEYYNAIIDKVKQQTINKISCGIGVSAELKYLKAFSSKVISLENNDQTSINQFSQLLSAIILFYLYSDNDDLDSLEVLNPDKPNNPLLTEKIKIK